MSAREKTRKKLLGEYLVDNGLVTKHQIEQALDAQKKGGARLGQTLIELGFLKEEDLIVILAKQLDIAHIDISSYGLKPQVVKLIPEQIARRHELIALEKMGNTLTVAITDPLNVFAIDEIQRLTQCRIEPVICMRSALFKALDRCYRKDHPESKQEIEPTLHAAGVSSAPESKETMAIIDGQEVIEIVNDIVSWAITEKATDIHIEPDENNTRVRYRVDGFLREVKTISKDVHLPVVSRIKVLAGLDISEKRMPQDGRFQFEFKDKKTDLRISTLPTVLGEKVVMRVLDKSLILIDLDRLGFLPGILSQYKELIKRPYGMILVTGPTSSGKTTTLYSALNTINTVEKNILTVEDPVEYRLKMVNQVQVNPRAGLTFATGLRSFLRQDPNVIMIGEIRDIETAEIAIQAALTGHLVFSTVHTNNAPSSITRLIDMKVEPFLVATAVIGILAQRLIRTICPNCKEVFVPPAEQIKHLNLSDEKKEITLYRGKGCDSCRGSGYKGRIGIFEFMLINDKIRELILQNASMLSLTQAAKENGMLTLREDGFKKVMMGLTTVEEVLRVTAEEAKDNSL